MDALTKDHVKQRLKFGNDHLHWDVHDWGLIVFSDESDLLPVKYGRQYVRLKEGQKFVDVIPLRETAKKEVTIKVWGTISFLGVGTLIRYEDTMDAITYKDILQDHLFQEYPMLENSAMELEGPIGELPRFGFVQDKSTSHTANKVREWMDLNDVNVIGWPSNSPDINIVENVWAYVQDKLFDVRVQIRSPNET